MGQDSQNLRAVPLVSDGSGVAEVAEMRVQSAAFDGWLAVRVPLVPMAGPPVSSADKFSIRMHGELRHPGQSSTATNDTTAFTHQPVLSMDDVMFGVELTRPLHQHDLPLPGWLVQAVRFWLNHIDSEIVLHRVHTSPTDPATCPCQTDHRLPSCVYPGAALFLPLVCAASYMRAHSPVTGDPMRDASLYRRYLASICVPSSVPHMIQTLQRQAEFHHLPKQPDHPDSEYHRARTLSYSGGTRYLPFMFQDPRPMPEDNRFIAASVAVLQAAVKSPSLMHPHQPQVVLQPPAHTENLSPKDRRALLRTPPKSLTSAVWHSVRSHLGFGGGGGGSTDADSAITSNSGGGAIHGKPTSGQDLRKALPFAAGTRYEMEFRANYFDLRSFEFRPLLSPGADGVDPAFHPTTQPPSTVASFFNGRWSIDGTEILRDHRQRMSEIRLVCKLRRPGVVVAQHQQQHGHRQQHHMPTTHPHQQYLWCIAFRLYD